MSSNCKLDFHISNLYKQCSNLADWILITFTMRDPQVMLTLYKSLVMSRLDYASQLWSPYLLKHVYLIEKVQRAFTKYISGMGYLSYREGERDIALFMCGKSSMDWYQTSLIISLALSLIVGEELALYAILVLVDWAP